MLSLYLGVDVSGFEALLRDKEIAGPLVFYTNPAVYGSDPSAVLLSVDARSVPAEPVVWTPAWFDAHPLEVEAIIGAGPFEPPLPQDVDDLEPTSSDSYERQARYSAFMDMQGSGAYVVPSGEVASLFPDSGRSVLHVVTYSSSMRDAVERMLILSGVVGVVAVEAEVTEAAPPGWSGTVKAMKKHMPASRAFALAWSGYKKGKKPRYPVEPGKPEYIHPSLWRPARESLDESSVVDKLVGFILKNMHDAFISTVARPVALYKRRGDYKKGEAWKLATKLVTAGGQAMYKSSKENYFDTYTPEVREQVARALVKKAEALEKGTSVDPVLPKKYQKNPVDESVRPPDSRDFPRHPVTVEERERLSVDPDLTCPACGKSESTTQCLHKPPPWDNNAGVDFVVGNYRGSAKCLGCGATYSAVGQRMSRNSVK